MSIRLLNIAPLCLVLGTVSACDRAEETARVAAQERVDSVARESEIWRPAPEREALPRARIYYTLTDHEWYAHGLPLMHEGRPYQPGGPPVAASLTEMTRAGAYEDVEYYTRGEDPVSLFVPVFEGYWLPFRADTSARGADTSARGANGTLSR